MHPISGEPKVLPKRENKMTLMATNHPERRRKKCPLDWDSKKCQCTFFFLCENGTWHMGLAMPTHTLEYSLLVSTHMTQQISVGWVSHQTGHFVSGITHHRPSALTLQRLLQYKNNHCLCQFQGLLLGGLLDYN